MSREGLDAYLLYFQGEATLQAETQKTSHWDRYMCLVSKTSTLRITTCSLCLVKHLVTIQPLFCLVFIDPAQILGCLERLMSALPTYIWSWIWDTAMKVHHCLSNMCRCWAHMGKFWSRKQVRHSPYEHFISEFLFSFFEAHSLKVMSF